MKGRLENNYCFHNQQQCKKHQTKEEINFDSSILSFCPVEELIENTRLFTKSRKRKLQIL